MDFDAYAGLLRMHDTATRQSPGLTAFTHDLANPAWGPLRERWPLEAVAGDGDAFARAFRLLQWLSLNTYHDGAYDNCIQETAADLLAHAFGQTREHGINCRALSIILTECLLAIGIPARTVSCIPASPYDGDNHVVVMALVSPDKWVMLDPTWNAYCMDASGHVLDPWELRCRLSGRSPIRLNPEARYNRKRKSAIDMAVEYSTYMAKNLYYLHCPLYSGWDPERRSPPVFLAPDGFDVLLHRRLNLAYRREQWGPHPLLDKWIADAWADQAEPLYATPAFFFTAP